MRTLTTPSPPHSNLSSSTSRLHQPFLLPLRPTSLLFPFKPKRFHLFKSSSSSPKESNKETLQKSNSKIPQSFKTLVNDDSKYKHLGDDGFGGDTALKGTILAALLLVGGFGTVGYIYIDQINAFLAQFTGFIQGYGPAGYALFIAVYAGLEILAIPAIPLTMSAGLLFGIPVVGQVTEVNKDTLCSYIVKEGNTSERLKVVSRRSLFLFLVSSGLFATSSASVKAKSKSPYDDKRLLEQNRRIQEANNVPTDFPNFIREGFEVKVVTTDSFVKCNSGLIYMDIAAGKGDSPKDGQQVTFHYVGYNESGRRIDSTYLQGTPAKIRMGTNALVPGFEEGIRDMKPGGKRRIVIPPELGPPVGPSTFFSSKQFEVFDVELLSIQNCERRTILAFYSDVVCN
ncbi:Peptidyl-prolyl cis-trans isomerase fkbp20-2 protein [Thalictrum thalictroides]|uniref:peptidylprolyl isomerase n=1 Tax=Thalictrum thalictroides TaxID=46969 RepID=A0A7J6WX59_THATH|nr:Peptidyl-prolyl cis-trans isomerase fkbp20-2 protein [Thalictrum thalictroides]